MKINLKNYKGNRLHVIDVSAVARTKWWNFKDFVWVVDGKEVGTGAIFAVLGLLKEIPLEDKMIFCFDLGGNNRKEDYDGYKGNRVSADDDYYVQMNKLREILINCGFEIMGQTGYEADDFIVGSVMDEKLYNEYDHIFVYTNDKDLTQLIDNKVIYRSVLTKQSDITIDNFEEELKIPYNTMVLYKATVGDASDNIKGIPKFGPKKFDKFIQEVSETYDLKEIRKTGKEKEIILNYKGFSDEDKGYALNSLRVVKSRLPNEYHFEDLFEKDIDKNMLIWYLNKYGMKSIIEKITEGGK